MLQGSSIKLKLHIFYGEKLNNENETMYGKKNCVHQMVWKLKNLTSSQNLHKTFGC